MKPFSSGYTMDGMLFINIGKKNYTYFVDSALVRRLYERMKYHPWKVINELKQWGYAYIDPNGDYHERRK